MASSLDTLQPVLLEGFESKEDLVACLKASANVPRIAGDPIQLRYSFSPAVLCNEATSEKAVPWQAAQVCMAAALNATFPLRNKPARTPLRETRCSLLQSFKSDTLSHFVTRNKPCKGCRHNKVLIHRCGLLCYLLLARHK